MTELTLYVRSGCHLCDDMKAELRPFQDELGFSVREIEVGWEGELAERYGRLLPVLTKNGTEICHYFLDPERLRSAFG